VDKTTWEEILGAGESQGITRARATQLMEATA